MRNGTLKGCAAGAFFYITLSHSLEKTFWELLDQAVETAIEVQFAKIIKEYMLTFQIMTKCFGLFARLFGA